MSATACLQVVVKHQRTAAANAEILDIIAKVTTAFLESRWAWPRRFETVSPSSYLLIDPDAAGIDPSEVQQLASKLQTRLFGVSDAGEVMLAAFEGTPEEVLRFSRLPADDLGRLLRGETSEPVFNGKLTRLTARETSVVEPPKAAAAPIAPPPPPRQVRLQYRGVYLLPRQEFIGSQASLTTPAKGQKQSVLHGLENYPNDDPEQFDRETIEELVHAFGAAPPPGLIFVPISFTALARPGMRERYQEYLEPLKRLPRALLVARIYDVPRNPVLGVLAQMKSFLQAYVAFVDIAVADPGIDVSALGSGIIRGVGLVLPTGDDLVRAAAISRFMSNRDRFRTQHLWPGIGNIRTRKEVQLVSALKVAFMAGPAITGILEQPLPVLPFLLDGLPLNDEPR